MKRTEKIAAMAAAILILGGIGMTLHVWRGYRKSREEYAAIRDKYTGHSGSQDRDPDDPEDTDKGQAPAAAGTEASADAGLYAYGEEAMPGDAAEPPAIAWDSLLADYSGVAAWLSLPAAGISYPVMQAGDNDYYLHRDPAGDYLYAGSIFLDYHNSPSLQNYNTVIYGHNMRDGSMFGKLKQYNDVDVLSSCPYFWVSVPAGDYLYRIFSVHTAAAGGDAYIVRFSGYEEYMGWITEMAGASAVETGAEGPQPGDKVVTLSTCTGDTATRQVVQGYLVYVVARD